MTEQKDILEKLNEIALEANWGTTERVNGVPKSVAVIQEAVEEIKALRKSDADLRLYETQMKNGEIDMTVGSEDCKTFIFGLIQIFKQNGAKNFLTTTVEVGDKHGERYALTIQKVGAESPAEQLSRIHKETAQAILQAVFEKIKEISAKSDCMLDDESVYEDSSLVNVLNIIGKPYGVEIDENASTQTDDK